MKAMMRDHLMLLSRAEIRNGNHTNAGEDVEDGITSTLLGGM